VGFGNFPFLVFILGQQNDHQAIMRITAQNPADSGELDDIESAFALLDSADPGMMYAERLPQVAHGDALLFSLIAQPGQ